MSWMICYCEIGCSQLSKSLLASRIVSKHIERQQGSDRHSRNRIAVPLTLTGEAQTRTPSPGYLLSKEAEVKRGW